jgi:adenine-specific DNA-methyltransferase
MANQKSLGQYFTVDESLQKFVYSVCKNKGQLLEPSFGAGHLLKQFLLSNPDYPMVCCEIDKKITPCVTFKEAQTVIYGDFIKESITQKFTTIVGNPPYVKQEKNRNLYLQFIEKCIGLLDTNGELIFIVPSDFLKLTSAAEIIRKMVNEGSFTDFYYPNNEKLFEDSSVDVVIFRYQKDLKTRKCLYNGVERTWHFNEGIITFSSPTTESTVTLGELFDCYVGFVSGRDKVFSNTLGNLNLLCDKDKVCPFICIDKYPSGNKAVDDYLMIHKKDLLERKIRKFDEDNWFTWGAIRNKTAIDERKGKDCIYVRTMTRKNDVAFIGKVQYFGGGLLCLCPKNDGLDLEPIVKLLNSSSVKQDYIYSGRFKIGQKQVRFVRI